MDDIKIPRGEEAWTIICDTNHDISHVITTKVGNRSVFYLYRVDGKKLVKLGSNQSPAKLEEKFIKKGG